MRATLGRLLAVGLCVRLALLAFGEWQDANRASRLCALDALVGALWS